MWVLLKENNTHTQLNNDLLEDMMVFTVIYAELLRKIYENKTTFVRK